MALEDLRVLGVDPGTRIVGYAALARRAVRQLPREAVASPQGPVVRNAVRRSTGRVECLESGTLRLGSASIPERLRRLADELDRLIADLRPQVLAVEEAFVGKSTQSALRLGEARGVVLVAAARAGVDVVQYAPATIKLRVAGSGRSSKAGLARVLAATFGSNVSSLSTDASDALAVAFCHCLELDSGFGG